MVKDYSVYFPDNLSKQEQRKHELRLDLRLIRIRFLSGSLTNKAK